MLTILNQIQLGEQPPEDKLAFLFAITDAARGGCACQWRSILESFTATEDAPWFQDESHIEPRHAELFHPPKEAN